MAEAKGGWEQHRREQLRRWRELSPQQRLDWLWQAKQFEAKASQACEARREGSTPRLPLGQPRLPRPS
jgi:hypothetical protein